MPAKKSSAPTEILSLIPYDEPGCALNWNKKSQRWYVFRWLGTTYDPVRKRGIDRRESVGYIKDGQFHYSKRYLLQKQLRTLQPEPQQPVQQVLEKAIESIQDKRQVSKVIYPIDVVLTVMMLASLSGYTGAVSIATYWKRFHNELAALTDHFPAQDISHDTVNRLLRLIEPKEMQGLIEKLTPCVMAQMKQCLLHGDGQCVRATHRQDQANGRYFFNVYSSENSLLIYHRLIDEKSNEIPSAYEAFSSLDVQGCTVTFDAMNTQPRLASLLHQRGAQYCMALKDNKNTLLSKVLEVLNHSSLSEHYEYTDAGHGRIEQRIVKVVPARLLDKKVLNTWDGLQDGCLVQIRCITESKRNYKTEQKKTEQTRYFLSSVAYEQEAIASKMEQIIRRHWSVENNLHWTLDEAFDQDRIQCKDANYLQNRVTLNKVALNQLKSWQNKLKEDKNLTYSIKTLMQLCCTPKDALETIALLHEK